MTRLSDSEFTTLCHRLRQPKYARSDKGRASRDRGNEKWKLGYRFMRAQGVSRVEAKTRAWEGFRRLSEANQCPI